MSRRELPLSGAAVRAITEVERPIAELFGGETGGDVDKLTVRDLGDIVPGHPA